MNQLEDKTKDPVALAWYRTNIYDALRAFKEYYWKEQHSEPRPENLMHAGALWHEQSLKDLSSKDNYQKEQVEDAKDAWRPISTAPTNERIILLMGDQPVFGYWCKQEYNTRPKPYWSCDKEILFGVGWCRANQPLFWMPSPAIAAQEGKK